MSSNIANNFSNIIRSSNRSRNEFNKNIQDRVMLKTSITISSANNEALKNKTTEAKIVAGTNHFIALTQDGKVYGWGSNGSGELGQNNTKTYTKRPTYLGIDDAIDIAAGYQSTVVLKKRWNCMDGRIKQ